MVTLVNLDFLVFDLYMIQEALRLIDWVSVDFGRKTGKYCIKIIVVHLGTSRLRTHNVGVNRLGITADEQIKFLSHLSD